MIKKLLFKRIIFCNIRNSEFDQIIEKNGLFTFPAGPTLANLKNGSEYHNALINSNFVFFDSGYFVFLLRLLKNIKVNKFSGYKFLKLLFVFLQKNSSKKIFLIDPSQNSSKINRVFFNNLGLYNIKNYVSPIYDKNTINDYILLKEIDKFKPDYLIINLAGGVQEILGLFIKQKTNKSLKIICTGGAISYFTGEQAPINKFIDNLYLGWFYRIIFNPKIFLKRYLKSFKLLMQVYREDLKVIKD
tara:strand:+ start:3838 stop:4572 length:735 start_codon:yes stop_codon:yes gene_type:complete